MSFKNFIKIIFCIFVSQMAGIIGSVFTVNSINDWYQFLEKPVFSPPNWVFGPVWGVLYTLMGISVYLIWTSNVDKKRKRKAMMIFWVHLLLNALWSPIFFGAQNLGLALVVIAVILAFIILMIKIFWPIRKASSYLLIPYLLWVSFATVLNFSIYLLN